MSTYTLERLADDFQSHRHQLLGLLRRHLKPALLQRLSEEDILSDVYQASARRLDFFANRGEVPIYFKFRTVLFQTLATLERRHLACQKRSVSREVSLEGADLLPQLPDDITSPPSHIDREERHSLIRRALESLSEADRCVLVLRHFDNLDNRVCAEILGISPKAAAQRHIRALERLHARIESLSCFRTSAFPCT